MRILGSRPGVVGSPRARARRARRSLAPALACALALAPFGACGDPAPAVDPAVAERPLPGPDTPLDSALARAGGEIFQRRCVACHKLGGGDLVGPDLSGVTEARAAVWLRGMILAPDSMLREDPVARELLVRYAVPMPDTELDEAGFRAVLEFMRSGMPLP